MEDNHLFQDIVLVWDEDCLFRPCPAVGEQHGASGAQSTVLCVYKQPSPLSNHGGSKGPFDDQDFLPILGAATICNTKCSDSCVCTKSCRDALVAEASSSLLANSNSLKSLWGRQNEPRSIQNCQKVSCKVGKAL